jgi:two-component system sensor histidine kinase GlrK
MSHGSLATQLRLTFGLFLALLGAVLVYHVRATREAAARARELTAQAARQEAAVYEQVHRLAAVHSQLERFIVRGGAPASARDTATSMVVSLDQASRRMEDLALSIVGAMEEALAAAEATTRKAERMALAIAAGAFLASVLLSLALIRAILRPLGRLTEGTRELATGRFAHRLPDVAPAEFAGVARDFNAMAGRLEELDRLKKDFVSTVSHDLKTPLSSMQETVEVMLEELPGPLTPRQRKLLELNRESARRLSQMLAKLLDLSRLNAESAPAREVIDVAAIARDTVERFDVARPGRGPAFELIAPPSGLWVRGNASGIAQLLENLIENAIKFSPAGTTIRVAVADLPANGTVLLSVADEGPGVPDADKDRVFDRFHQTPTGRAVINRGVGLGLSICRHIVDAHGGMIWVADHEPRGAVFCVLLPGPGVSVESAA